VLCPGEGRQDDPAGAFADQDFPALAVEAYEERSCPWLPALGIEREP
jgi:hypothetical protein